MIDIVIYIHNTFYILRGGSEGWGWLLKDMKLNTYRQEHFKSPLFYFYMWLKLLHNHHLSKYKKADVSTLLSLAFC